MDVPSQSPVLALAGPTASGKTAVAAALARDWPIEVVSVDSVQVFLGMDAGTAKPSPEILSVCPHHLLDILSPEETYSAARFVEDAVRSVGEIRARGRIPLFVGGTLLYFTALARGLFPAPAPDPVRRAALAGLTREELLARLKALDTEGASEMEKAPARRIARAIEIVEAVGPIRAARAGTRPAPFPVEIHALLPPPEVLRGRIAGRTEEIFRRGPGGLPGLLAEVEGLRARGIGADFPSQSAIGYREAHLVLAGAIDEPEARRRVLVATSRYAKRQRTWLRNTLPPRTASPDENEAKEILARRISEMLGSPG